MLCSIITKHGKPQQYRSAAPAPEAISLSMFVFLLLTLKVKGECTQYTTSYNLSAFRTFFSLMHYCTSFLLLLICSSTTNLTVRTSGLVHKVRTKSGFVCFYLQKRIHFRHVIGGQSQMSGSQRILGSTI